MNIENRVALGLGGNMGNRLYHIAWAQQLITKNIGQIIQCSPLYQTAAWGNTDQPHFLNQVIVVITPFTPLQTLQKCLQIEKSMGRHREIKWGPRLIDIDICYITMLKHNTRTFKSPTPSCTNADLCFSHWPMSYRISNTPP
jgi:2-amino-4-hydroxy-6-hydroxymethyldihydropteridine diphosphokinase